MSGEPVRVNVCPACGSAYGARGVHCYPGVPRVRTRDGAGLAGFCQRSGRLEVPVALAGDVRAVVRDLRAAGAGWESVAAWLRRFGLKLPEQPMAPEPRSEGPQSTSQARRLEPQGPRSGHGSSIRSRLDCPQSVTGHAVGRDGTCTWCGRRIDPSMPAPRITGRSELSDAYRRHYDPDWGSDRKDH